MKLTMNKVIVLTLFTVFVFVAVVVVCNVKGILIQDALITAFLALMGAELALMGGIKITNTVKGKKKNGGADNESGGQDDEQDENEDGGVAAKEGEGVG